MSTDNLDAAQALITAIDTLTPAADAEGGLEIVDGYGGAMTTDIALQVAQTRALVDIARSLRGIETALGINAEHITRC